MPPVCSNSTRRSCVSVVPNRSAIPGRYQTGSIATLTTDKLPFCWMYDAVGLQTPGDDRVAHLVQIEPRLGDRDGRADVLAFRDLGLERIGDEMAPRIERDDAPRLRPLRERTDGRGRMRIGEIGPADRIEGAGGNRQRPVERIGAAVAPMTLRCCGRDTVAMIGPRSRAVAAPQ